MTEPKPDYSQVTQAARIAAYPEETQKMREGKMSEIPPEYLERTPEQERLYRIQLLRSDIVFLLYGGKYGDLSISEKQSVLSTLLDDSIQKNMRQKRK